MDTPGLEGIAAIYVLLDDPVRQPRYTLEFFVLKPHLLEIGWLGGRVKLVWPGCLVFSLHFRNAHSLALRFLRRKLPTTGHHNQRT